MTAIRKEVVIGSCRLLLGDCLEVMRELEPVDHILTDPPYADRTHQMAKTNQGAGHGRSLVSFAALSSDGFSEVATAMLGAASEWVVMTCDFRHAALLYDWPQFVRLGAWVKPNPMPQISADRPGQGFETVAILHAGGKPKAWNRGGGSGVWTFPVHTGALVPTQKPINLICALVSDFTKPGQTILDPFCGSGTTGVAAAKLGRSFIGIERDPKHFDVAVRRIEEAHRQPDMFVAQPARVAPVQTSIFDGFCQEKQGDSA